MSLSVIKDGIPWDVSQEIGLGIREHDDVMLSQGKSRKVTVNFDIPANQYALIVLDVPEGIGHHAEGRFTRAAENQCEVYVIPNYSGSLPGSPTDVPVWDQRGPLLIDPADQKSTFQAWNSLGTSNPLSGVDLGDFSSDWIDKATLRAEAGGFFSASEKDEFASVVGRYYYPGKHCVLIKNETGGTCEFEYAYRWHEFG